MEVEENHLGTSDGKKISMSSEKINAAISNGYNEADILYNFFMHEIGHNLGGAHADGGVMENVNMMEMSKDVTSNGEDKNKKRVFDNKLKKKNVEAIINTIWKKDDPERPGEVNEPEVEKAKIDPPKQ
jgi:hypothetical protein